SIWPRCSRTQRPTAPRGPGRRQRKDGIAAPARRRDGVLGERERPRSLSSRPSTRTWNPWTLVRCRVVGMHRWDPIAGGDLDTGWGCTDCVALVLKWYFDGPYVGRFMTSPYRPRAKNPRLKAHPRPAPSPARG